MWVFNYLTKHLKNMDELKRIQVLEAYFKTMGRFAFIIALLISPFLVLTLAKFFEINASYYSIDLKLDGSTLASYVSTVLSAVVALAGSLLAIMLALKAQETSDETKRLEQASNKRETDEYAREIRKELGSFLRGIEKTSFSLRLFNQLKFSPLVDFFSLQYYSAFSDSESEIPFAKYIHTDKYSQTMLSTLDKAIKSSSGFKYGVIDSPHDDAVISDLDDRKKHDRLYSLNATLLLNPSNVPNSLRDFVAQAKLEKELEKLKVFLKKQLLNLKRDWISLNRVALSQSLCLQI